MIAQPVPTTWWRYIDLLGNDTPDLVVSMAAQGQGVDEHGHYHGGVGHDEINLPPYDRKVVMVMVQTMSLGARQKQLDDNECMRRSGFVTRQ